MAYRWPARPGTRIGGHKDQQQYIFGPEYICHQWASMFFDHVRQSPETEGKYRVHHPVFAGRIESGIGPVFGVREPIRACIAHGSPGVGVFIWGRPWAMGRGGIEPGVE